MFTRHAIPAVVASAFALLFFGLGNYLAAIQNAESDGRFAAHLASKFGSVVALHPDPGQVLAATERCRALPKRIRTSRCLR